MCRDLLDILVECFDDLPSNKSLKGFARQVNLSPDMIYKIVEGKRKKQDLIDIIIALVNYSGDVRPVQHIGAQCNTLVLPMPERGTRTQQDIIEDALKCQEDMGDCIREVARSIRDGRVKKGEAREMLCRLRKAMNQSALLMQVLEEVSDQ